MEMKLTINYNNCYVCPLYRQSIALLKQRTGEYFIKNEVFLTGRILINDERRRTLREEGPTRRDVASLLCCVSRCEISCCV